MRRCKLAGQLVNCFPCFEARVCEVNVVYTSSGQAEKVISLK